MSVFVDSAIWFAAMNRSDRSNARAKQILSSNPDLVTSSFVLLETWLLLRNKINWHAAETFWDKLQQGVANLEAVTSADLEAARMIGQRYSDQEFSITDRTSFAIMERLRITQVATLDNDFAVYRYGRGNNEAFEILR